MYWGLTPALDLQSEIKANGKIPKEINILIVGSQDCRHVLKTLAYRYRHEEVKINFYLVEAVLESIAKQLFLLNIALQPDSELGVVQKTRYFMELYGNTLIRPAVAKYLKSRALEFVEMITDLDYMKLAMPFINLDLKFKERDYLENLYKFWCSDDPYNICDYWDSRLRKMLGIRYDNKMGAFEWDLHMRFHSIGGNQVCSHEYKHWRSTGVAFTWLESEVSKANRSFVCGVISNGTQFLHHGYLGEVQTGPFVTFGLECEDPEFIKRTNGLNAQRATDVTERNLRQFFHEIQSKTEYSHQKISDINLGAVTFLQSELKVVDSGAAGDVSRKHRKPCISLDEVTINFVSINNLSLWKHRENLKDLFNLVYFGSTYLNYLKCDVLEEVCADNALLIIENQLFVLNHRDKQLEEFEKTLSEALEPLKKLVAIPFNSKKDSYAKFILQK